MLIFRFVGICCISSALLKKYLFIFILICGIIIEILSHGGVMLKYKKLNIIVGHYGSGKTNVAVNLALHAKNEKPIETVRIADLDIVNPYFRTADSASLLTERGIEVLLPEFANTNVDIPALPPKMFTMFENNGYSFIDVGGDDGAVALGMYRHLIEKVPHEVFYVINMYRPLIADPEDAVSCMRDIEAVSGLSVTAIINNSSLGEETDADTVRDSFEYAKKCASLVSVPLAAHTYVKQYAGDLENAGEPLLMPIDDITKKLF